ncbi:MAG: hypothetical protein ACP5O1_06430 [Phycisphaerae bacterium]
MPSRIPFPSLNLPPNRWLQGFWRLVACWVACAISLVLIGGCAKDAINPHARTTFINSHDLIVMTDRMAADIASSPVLARLTARTPMVIALTPLVNETNSIITRGQGDAFLHRIRLLLSSHRSLQTRFVFVISRNRFRDVHQQTLAGGSASERLLPQYALQATFYADTHVAPKLRSDYYLCTFYLTRIGSGAIIWQGSYEMQKVVHSSFLY